MASTNDLQCAACGFANRARANFCGMCGTSISAMPSAERVGERSTLSGPTPRVDIPGVSVLSWLQASLSHPKRVLSPVSVALLAGGALVAAFGQAYLTLAYEPGRAAPNFGVIFLAIGFVLFALGAFGRSASDDAADSLSSAGIAAFPSGIGKFSPSQVLAVSLGGGLMAVLVFRLLSSSESGWDMLLWLMALSALAIPFIRRPYLSQASVTAIRERTPDILMVAALVGIFVALNSHDLTDWYYSAIGDEYAHYNFARELAEDGLKRPFDLDGVYSEINPVMASVYPALVMRLVGVDNFGWKFSLIISVALTIPGVYILGHLISGRFAAFVSAATVAFSHYIFAFMHTGYPNTDVLPIIVWSIALFAVGVRRGNPFLIYASGFLAGLGLLFNIVARAAIPIVILYALSHSDIRRRLVSLWPWAVGVSLVVVPLLLVNGSEVLSTALVKIVGPGSQHATEYEGIISQVTANAIQNLMAFSYNPHTSHYVSGALLDPISAVLALLGLAYCLGTAHGASSRLLLVLFAVLAAGTALLSPYPYVPITRMSSMVIPLALMAGSAAAFLFKGGVFPQTGDNRSPHGMVAVTVLGALALVVLALNALQFWYATPRVFHHTQEAVAIGAMRSDACEGEPDGLIIIGRTTVPLLKPALESYNPGGALPRLLDHSDVNTGGLLPSKPARCIIFLNPEDADIQAFRQELSARFPEGRFTAFSSPSGKASVDIFKPDSGWLML